MDRDETELWLKATKLEIGRMEFFFVNGRKIDNYAK